MGRYGCTRAWSRGRPRPTPRACLRGPRAQRGVYGGCMSSPVSVGNVLGGKFRVQRVLGTGGMGVIVAAFHLQLEQEVALKFLLADAAKQPEVVARFAREARA